MSNTGTNFMVPEQDYALEMLRQYYEDLRSIYDSLFQVFKLFSASIVFSGTALGLFFKDGDANDSDVIFLIVYVVMVFISLFCVLLTLGQAYRYRITQHFCSTIRKEKKCEHYIPKSVYGNYNFLSKTLPTLFFYTYIFFSTFIAVISLALILKLLFFSNICFLLNPISGVTLLIVLSSFFLISSLTRTHTKKIANTIKNSSAFIVGRCSNENAEDIKSLLKKKILLFVDKGYDNFIFKLDADEFNQIIKQTIIEIQSSLPNVTFTAILDKSNQYEQDALSNSWQIVKIKSIFKCACAKKVINYCINNSSLLICYYSSQNFNSEKIIQNSKNKNVNIVNFCKT